MDVLKGVLTVSTTRKTYDPYIIIKGRDMLKLLSRSVPYEQVIMCHLSKSHCKSRYKDFDSSQLNILYI